MKKTSTVASLALSLVLSALPTIASAKVTTINLGYTGAEGGSYTFLADKFEELAEKYTNGSVDVKVRCCGQLVTEDEAFKAMQLGTLDMTVMTSSNISPHYPLMDVFALPYIFHNTDHAAKILDGKVGQKLADDLYSKTKVHLLSFGGLGYRDFYNSVRPINTVDDFKGLKIRVPKNEVMIKTFDSFGASPIPIAWADTPTALQTGAVVGADNGTMFIKAQKFYEIADNLAILDHFSFFTPLLASNRIMKKLDSEQTEAIKKAAIEAGLYQREELTKQREEVREFLAEKGMKVTRPDRSTFIAAAEKVQNEIAAEKGEEFTNLLNAIKSEAN